MGRILSTMQYVLSNFLQGLQTKQNVTGFFFFFFILVKRPNSASKLKMGEREMRHTDRRY